MPTHQRFETAIDILSTLVGFDTTSANSNLELIDFIRNFLEHRKIESTLVLNEDHSKAGLIAKIGEGQGGVALSGHTDVVPAKADEWKTNPFELIKSGESYYGRGSADMKGFIACALAKVDEFIAAKHKKPVYLVFSYDEEIGCRGALPLAEKMKELGYQPDFAIIGEPTEMRVATAHKGIHATVTTLRGADGHSSNPATGVNAILYAARLIGFLEKLQNEYKEKVDERFVPPHTTFNVGVITGGKARNIIAGECEFVWETRPIPEVKVAEIMERFESYCRELEREAANGDLKLQIKNKNTSSVPGLTASGAHVNEVLRLAGSNEAISVSFATEAGIFAHEGIPSIVMGPGSINDAHKPDEYIAGSQISACLTFMDKLSGHLT